MSKLSGGGTFLAGIGKRLLLASSTASWLVTPASISALSRS
jgi:hypothetical protein